MKTQLMDFLAMRLVMYLNEYYHPHVELTITPTGYELKEGIESSGYIEYEPENEPLPIKATLKFSGVEWENKNFRDGLNMTCRRGTYWDNKVNIGDWVEIATYDGYVTDTACIVDKYVMKFKDIPKNVLNFAHGENYADFSNLYVAMMSAYGKSFTEDEICTFLIFEPLRYED